MSKDDVFCAFFRLPDPPAVTGRLTSSSPNLSNSSETPTSAASPAGKPPRGKESIPSMNNLDLLSLLACFRQGIEPADLLYQANAEDADIKDPRRRAKFRLLEQERSTISTEVLQQRCGDDGSGKTSKTRLALGTELQSLLNRLHPGQANPRLTISVQEERLATVELLRQVTETEDRKMTLLHRSRGVLSVNQQNETTVGGQGGDDEIAKLRTRQLRFVSKELQKELEGQQIAQRMLEEEERRREQREIRNRQLAHDAAIRQSERQRRLQSVHEKTEKKYQKAKDQATAHDKKVAEKEERRLELLASKASAQREKSKVRMAMVKKRALIVQQDTEVRAELLSHEMTQKQQLHEERKMNLALRRDTQRELTRIRDLHQSLSLKEWTEKQQVYEEVKQVELYQKYAAQDERVEHLLESVKHHSEHIHREIEEKHALALKRRDVAVLERLQRRQERLQRSLKREENLLQIQDANDVYKRNYFERNRQRQQNNEDNRIRLERLAEYKVSLQEAKVKKMEERAQQIEAFKAQQALSRQLERQRLADQRKHLIETVMEVRYQQPNLGKKFDGDIANVEAFVREKLEAMESAQKRTPRAAVPRNVFSQISWHDSQSSHQRAGSPLASPTESQQCPTQLGRTQSPQAHVEST